MCNDISQWDAMLETKEMDDIIVDLKIQEYEERYLKAEGMNILTENEIRAGEIC